MKQSTHTLPAQERKGLWIIFLPFFLIILVLFGYAILNFMINPEGIDQPNTFGASILTTGNYFFGIIAILTVLTITLLFPIGLRLLFRVEPTMEEWDQRSGKGKKSVVPNEIKKWNWGAAGLVLYWAIYHRVWPIFFYLPFILLPSLRFTPLLGTQVGSWIILISRYLTIIIPIALIILFGLKGNQWAWRRNKWKGVEDFKTAQQKWKIWGIVFFIFTVIVIAFRLFQEITSLLFMLNFKN